MKTKALFAFLSALTFFFSSHLTAHAAELAGSSARFAYVTAPSLDTRTLALSEYLHQHNSPMAPYAYVFVREADKNGLPWDFVAAIAGTESTFGQQEPGPACFNGWGWGIYGDNTLCFRNYEEAITTISQEIRIRYIEKWNAQTVDEIGRYYAASPTWSAHTTWFMQQIELFKIQYDSHYLPISL